jgi:WD40 repeat protein
VIAPLFPIEAARPLAQQPAGTRLLMYTGHQNEVKGLAWSPDGQYIISCASEETAHVWNVATGKRVLEHGKKVKHVLWSPSGRYVASAEEQGGGIEIWEALTGNKVQKYPEDASGSYYTYALAWSPDGRCMASARLDSTVDVWDVKTGKTLISYTKHRDIVYGLAWSPDSRFVASGGNDRTVQVWDARTGDKTLHLKHSVNFLTKAIHLNDAPYLGDVSEVVWSPDGRWIASVSFPPGNQWVRLWDAVSGEELLAARHYKSLFGYIAWSPDGKWLAGREYNNSVQVLEPETGRQHFTYTGQAQVTALAWSPDSQRIASCAGHEIHIWQAI